MEVSTHLRRGARLRHDNMVKNHWNGKLSTSYHKGFMSTAFVRRQKVLLPMRDLMALLQASCCIKPLPVCLLMGWLGGSPFTHALLYSCRKLFLTGP